MPEGTGPIVSAHRAEIALRAVAGLSCTFVRAAYFMENILMFAHPMKADGVLPVFGGGESYPFPMVATKDIGHTVVQALLSRPAAGTIEIVELSGPTESSMADAAAAASDVLGKPVRAVALPLDGVVAAMKGLGCSDNFAGLYREMLAAIGTGLVRFEGNGRSNPRCHDPARSARRARGVTFGGACLGIKSSNRDWRITLPPTGHSNIPSSSIEAARLRAMTT